jgi:hypothetical protein
MVVRKEAEDNQESWCNLRRFGFYERVSELQCFGQRVFGVGFGSCSSSSRAVEHLGVLIVSHGLFETCPST